MVSIKGHAARHALLSLLLVQAVALDACEKRKTPLPPDPQSATPLSPLSLTTDTRSAAALRPPAISVSCKDYPAALQPAAPKDRGNVLASLHAEFPEANDLVTALEHTPLNAPTYYAAMERLAERLNDLQFTRKPGQPGAIGTAFAKLWQDYSLPASRSEATTRVSTQCLDAKDDAFSKYAAELTTTISRIAGLLPAPAFALFQERAASVPTLPAGLDSPFAATNSFTPTGARICVNPEEAPPWLIGRMMHEYVHSKNNDIKQLLSNYTDALEDEDQARIALLRPTVDLERFLDEHRAYLIDVLASRAIIATAPDYFCRLWVPSYAAQRPILYPQAYVELEQAFEDGTAGAWIGKTYTFKMRVYRPGSLYVHGDEGAGFLPDVARRSQQLLGELWPRQ